MIFTPLDIPLISNKESILKNFIGKDNFAWWKEETLLGVKDLSKPFGEPKQWIESAKEDHQLVNEPIGYRFIVSGSRDTLYMCNEYDYARDMSNQPKHFCTIPNDTDAFLINNCTQPHGVDVKEGIDDDRIVGFILGKVNVKQHQELLEKSKNKYSKQVVIKNELRV